MPAPVLNELADELTIARRMNWILTDYTYWRNAALPNTEGRFDRTSFGATLPGSRKENVRSISAMVPGVNDYTDDGTTVWFALTANEAWAILYYDDGTLLGLYDRSS